MDPFEISQAVTDVKRAQAAKRRAEKEKAEINEVAKQQRVIIRRLKRLLEEAMKLIPATVRADKFYEEVDRELHREEL